MTRFLLDTNVISETARQKPEPRVIECIRHKPSLLLPSIAVYTPAAGVKRAQPHGTLDFLPAAERESER